MEDQRMKRALQGCVLIILLTTGLFSAYELIYAKISAPGVGTNLAAANNSNDPLAQPLQESAEPDPQGLQQVALNPVQPSNSPNGQNEQNTPTPQGEIPVVEADQLANILVLANKSSALPDTYIPGDLVTAQVRFAPNVLPEKKKLRQEAAEALAVLMEGANEDNIELYCVSGYRSYGTQKAIYQAKLKATGLENTSKYVAYPGQSEHQTGLAMDLTNKAGINKSLNSGFGQTEEGQWLQAKAHLYGFIIRYPAGKENTTGYSYEPWHIRYVGKDVAEEIYRQGQTLEEYLAASI